MGTSGPVAAGAAPVAAPGDSLSGSVCCNRIRRAEECRRPSVPQPCHNHASDVSSSSSAITNRAFPVLTSSPRLVTLVGKVSDRRSVRRKLSKRFRKCRSRPGFLRQRKALIKMAGTALSVLPNQISQSCSIFTK